RFQHNLTLRVRSVSKPHTRWRTPCLACTPEQHDRLLCTLWRCTMLWHTALAQRLGLDYPIIQAPLAGGGDTPALVAAVCQAGAFGFIGASYLTPEQIVEAAQTVRARTARPFGINLFAPLPAPVLLPAPGPSIACVASFYAELGLPLPSRPASGGYPFD